MNFKEVLAISGQPGLYKYLAQAKNGIIVEALADGKRTQVSANARVSALNDIAIYTEGEDLPLAEVFQAIYDKMSGAKAIDAKAKNEDIAAAFAECLPQYDKERVRVSDIKKVFAWYNILQATGMTSFVQVEEEAEVQEAQAE